MQKILLLDNYDSFTYNLRQLLHETDVAHQLTIAYNDAIPLEEVQNFDKILLSPGAGLPADAGIMPALIQAYAPQKTILGVCLGHQALAEAFGGALYALPAPQHGQAVPLEITLPASPLFAQVPPDSLVGLYHSWAVKSCPQFQVLAQAQEVIMAIAHERYALWGVQFHPESIITTFGLQMLKNWLLQ